MKYIYYIIAVLVFGSSCVKPIDLDLPAYSSKIVVNGEFDSDTTISVQVSRSLPIMQTSDSTGYLLQNAVVTIFENGTSIGNAVYFSGRYVLNKKPVIGATYDVEVSAPNYTKAKASLKMPNAIPINASYIDSIGLDADGFKVGQLTVSMTDDASTKNYYKFSIRYFSAGISTWFPLDIISNDVVFLNNDKLGDGSYLFSDRTFSGKTKTLKFNIESSSVSGSPKFEISIKTFNEDYFNYLRQTDDYSQSGNGFSNDPVILRTNVINGLGMVGGVSNAKKTLF
jgi:hypothetical protein